MGNPVYEGVRIIDPMRFTFINNQILPYIWKKVDSKFQNLTKAQRLFLANIRIL